MEVRDVLRSTGMKVSVKHQEQLREFAKEYNPDGAVQFDQFLSAGSARALAVSCIFVQLT